MTMLGNRRENALSIARAFREYASETHMADFAALMNRTADELEQLAATGDFGASFERPARVESVPA